MAIDNFKPTLWETALAKNFHENSCVSLSDFLSGSILGKPFDRDKQILCFNQIAANNDGTCGVKTHNCIKHKVIN